MQALSGRSEFGEWRSCQVWTRLCFSEGSGCRKKRARGASIQCVRSSLLNDFWVFESLLAQYKKLAISNHNNLITFACPLIISIKGFVFEWL